MNNLYDALEICLQEIEKGADAESVLSLYPDLADELRPIVETSVQAKNLAVADPSSEVVRRNRAKVLQQVALMREGQGSPSHRFWSVPLRRALVSLTIILMLFMTGTGLVRASSTTLPGDNLYPVKRTWEDVRLLFAFDMKAREALEIEHENKRLEEVNELFAEGRAAKVDFTGYITDQNGDLWLVSKIPVLISAQTELRDPSLGIGDVVRVRGFTRSDGTVLAVRVEQRSDGMPMPQVEDDDSPEFEQEKPEDEDEGIEDNSGRGSGDETPEAEETEDPEDDSGHEDSSGDGSSNSGSGSSSDNENDENDNDNSGSDDNSNDNDDDTSGEDNNDNDEDNSGGD